jgi:AAA15 family ATPase/GTPase
MDKKWIMFFLKISTCTVLGWILYWYFAAVIQSTRLLFGREPSANVNILIGDNGSGKSSILQGIVLGWLLYVCLSQCCGTVMICCGSGSRSTLEKFWFRFRIQTIFIQFTNNKNLAQNLVFSMSEAALFSRKFSSHLWFFTYSILCLVRIQLRFRNRKAFRFR